MAKLADTTVYGDLTVTGTIRGTVSSTLTLASSDDSQYIPRGLLRITEADGTTHNVSTFVEHMSFGVVYEVAGLVKPSPELTYPIVIEKLTGGN